MISKNGIDMTKLARIMGAELVGPVTVRHGAFGAQQMAQEETLRQRALYKQAKQEEQK